jgi:hypothetical protein
VCLPARRVAAAKAPAPILRPVGVGVHVTNLRLERGVMPVDLAPARRARIETNRVGERLCEAPFWISGFLF